MDRKPPTAMISYQGMVVILLAMFYVVNIVISNNVWRHKVLCGCCCYNGIFDLGMAM